MNVKTVILLIIALSQGAIAYPQGSAMSWDEKRELERELAAKRDELFRANGLNTFERKELKSLVGERICSDGTVIVEKRDH